MIYEKHGMAYTKEHKSWSEMKARCYNKNNAAYSRYGGRGITVDPKWLSSFKAFYEDMGERPKSYSLDRIDNDGNYTPDNCRWASNTTQTLNRRVFKSNTSGVRGVYWHKTKKVWCAKIGHNYKLIDLGQFQEKSDAIAARLAGEKIYHVQGSTA